MSEKQLTSHPKYAILKNEQQVDYIPSSFGRRIIIESNKTTRKVYPQGLGDVAQYKSSGNDKSTGKKSVNAIPIDEVTLTFIRFSKPVALFSDMEKSGYRVDEYHPGVYYITGMADIRMQIVVCRELVGDEYITLRVIGTNVSEKDIKKFILLSNDLDDSSEKAAYDIIMQISMTENQAKYSRAKEDKAVCEALGILMKDEIEAQVNEKAEDIATRMIRKNKPLDEIKEFTDIPESRIRELASEVGLKIIN